MVKIALVSALTQASGDLVDPTTCGGDPRPVTGDHQRTGALPLGFGREATCLDRLLVSSLGFTHHPVVQHQLTAQARVERSLRQWRHPGKGLTVRAGQRSQDPGRDHRSGVGVQVCRGLGQGNGSGQGDPPQPQPITDRPDPLRFTRAEPHPPSALSDRKTRRDLDLSRGSRPAAAQEPSALPRAGGLRLQMNEVCFELGDHRRRRFDGDRVNPRLDRLSGFDDPQRLLTADPCQPLEPTRAQHKPELSRHLRGETGRHAYRIHVLKHRCDH